jgi:hypothetical protein
MYDVAVGVATRNPIPCRDLKQAPALQNPPRAAVLTYGNFKQALEPQNLPNECPNLISSYLILSRFATASQSWLPFTTLTLTTHPPKYLLSGLRWPR